MMRNEMLRNPSNRIFDYTMRWKVRAFNSHLEPLHTVHSIQRGGWHPQDSLTAEGLGRPVVRATDGALHTAFTCA